MKPRISRKLLLLYDEEPHGTLSSPAFSDNPPVPFPETPSPAAVNETTTASTSAMSFKEMNKPLDSSLTLTLTALLAALFFMGSFSIYMRRFSDEDHDDGSTIGSPLRRSRSNGSGSSRSLPFWSSDRHGLDPSAVGSLPVLPYRGDVKHQIDCTICLAEFEEGEAVKHVPRCKHVFHLKCIDTWLASHMTCPLCRGTLSFGGKGTPIADGDGFCSGTGELMTHTASSLSRADTCIDARSVGLRRTRSNSNPGVEDHAPIERALSF